MQSDQSSSEGRARAKKGPPLGKRALGKGEPTQVTSSSRPCFAAIVHSVLSKDNQPILTTACGRARLLTQYIVVPGYVVKPAVRQFCHRDFGVTVTSRGSQPSLRHRFAAAPPARGSGCFLNNSKTVWQLPLSSPRWGRKKRGLSGPQS